MIKKMGSISKILGFMPGVSKYKDALNNVDDREFEKMSVLIHSMTAEERKNPKLVDDSSRRRTRIARGAGMQVSDLNRLRQALDQQKQMAKQMSKMSEKDLTGLQNNPSKLMPKQKIKKGKGKNKGQFRF
jgi:signal recognition particle subunit SRP54